MKGNRLALSKNTFTTSKKSMYALDAKNIVMFEMGRSKAQLSVDEV